MDRELCPTQNLNAKNKAKASQKAKERTSNNAHGGDMDSGQDSNNSGSFDNVAFNNLDMMDMLSKEWEGSRNYSKKQNLETF